MMQVESTRQNDTARVNKILREQEDGVAAQNPNLTRQEHDIIRLHRNQVPSDNGTGTFPVPPLSGAPVGTFVTDDVTNPSFVNPGTSDPTSFWIHFDPNY